MEGSDDYDPQMSEFPLKFHDSIRLALQDQRKIGWHNAIKGYLSIEWRSLAEFTMYDAAKAQPGRGSQ